MSDTETLYIIMRTDMDSMNPGKGMAQAAHAANAAVFEIKESFQEYWGDSNYAADTADGNTEEDMNELRDTFAAWETSTRQGFGTTIVLGADLKEICTVVSEAMDARLTASVVRDPLYPIRDGEVTHHLPLITGAYVFAPDRNDEEVRRILGGLSLHP